jgi:hypothetical protein
MDRNRHMATRTATTPDSTQTSLRTSSYHYAEMRCAENTARRLSDEIAGHNTLATLTGVTWDGGTNARAVRDSYYLLAAAHRSAAGRIERRSRRALAWSDFKANPFLQIGVMAGDRARSVSRKASRLVRSIRRAVNV